jgi:hypothetical protein
VSCVYKRIDDKDFETFKNLLKIADSCNEGLIFVTGLQKSGKSKLLESVFHQKSGSSVFENTREPQVFSLEKNFFHQERDWFIVDFPAINDILPRHKLLQILLAPIASGMLFDCFFYHKLSNQFQF